MRPDSGRKKAFRLLPTWKMRLMKLNPSDGGAGGELMFTFLCFCPPFLHVIHRVLSFSTVHLGSFSIQEEGKRVVLHRRGKLCLKKRK